MPRNRKTSPAEDIVEIVSRLPWWVGVLAAAISYFLFAWLATPDKVVVTDIKQFGEQAGRMIWKMAARFAQYLVPIACLAGAVTSAWKGRQRKSLVNTVAKHDSADALDGMSWREFELTVGEAFRLDGFQVEQRGGAVADGGIDLVLRRGGEKFFVQCKQWKAFKVGVDVVRELYGVMAALGATGGFVVTSGTFSRDAIDFANGRNIVLVDGEILFDMIKHARRSPNANPRSEPLDAADATPKCPICAAVMVKRVAKRGAVAGEAFWGCSQYPKCKGTRPIVE
ncbi:MAG: restriction endonuclease [Gammaproteobacteria bacterium]|nr:restriction endonuclease [Gammaproteobacteria bacterium]